MRIESLDIAGCFVIEHEVFPDERGMFREWFKQSAIEKLGIDFHVAQANFSVSKRGVIRGLHYSLTNNGQKKLITCTHGSITDVLVDIRTDSPTFLNQVSNSLESSSGRTILIDSGVAHGFSVSSETAAIAYLTSSEYASEYEKGINPFDIDLKIVWALPNGVQAVVSRADSDSISFEKAKNTGALPKYMSAI